MKWSRSGGRIAFATGGIKATPSASDHPALFDGEDLDPVVAKEDVIADHLADQSAHDGRDIGDRSRSGIARNVCHRPSSRANVTREPNATVSRSTGSGIS